ncbi:MAG TPA: hypothetical protein PKC03_00895 [Dokdonella sp.]|nr:hypothetical protein [Dokdonella sp.]
MKHFCALFFLCLTGCATMQWGEFDGQRSRTSDPDVYDVLVVAADGLANFDKRKQQRLKPGFHLLVVASAKKGNNGEVASISFPINVKPCTRYSFVAKHRSRLDIYNWDLVPVGETTMAGCEAPQK